MHSYQSDKWKAKKCIDNSITVLKYLQKSVSKRFWTFFRVKFHWNFLKIRVEWSLES